MKLPDTAESIVETACENAIQLIERGFWEIPKPRFTSWYNQFCGLEEQFFAACILNQVLFRNHHQFEAALRSLFRSNLYGHLYDGFDDLNLVNVLKNRRKDPNVRLVPVICESDPPTKSGPLVLRRLQRVLELHPGWMCWPWQARKAIDESGVKAIVFVDDFLGSGRQFREFFEQWGFSDEPAADVQHFYAPVVAHVEGIKHLSTNLPNLRVVAAERLGAAHDFFSESVWERNGLGCVTADEAKSWYSDFGQKRRCKPKTISDRGCGEFGLTFGFSHATPNNSLPILWYGSADWQPLLER